MKIIKIRRKGKTKNKQQKKATTCEGGLFAANCILFCKGIITQMTTKKNVKEKSRYFTFLLYPDSAPEDWDALLTSTGIPMAISPLHDKDLAKDGSLKKPHFHVIYVANNPVTADSVRKKIQRALGKKESVQMVQIIRSSVENVYKYLTHESEDAIAKNKFVYSSLGIKHLNGFNLEDYIKYSPEETKQMMVSIMELAINERLENAVQLYFFLEMNDEWVNPVTGEVMPLIDGSEFIKRSLGMSVGFFRLVFDGVFQENKKKKEGDDSSYYSKVKQDKIKKAYEEKYKKNEEKQKKIEEEYNKVNGNEKDMVQTLNDDEKRKLEELEQRILMEESSLTYLDENIF